MLKSKEGSARRDTEVHEIEHPWQTLIFIAHPTSDIPGSSLLRCLFSHQNRLPNILRPIPRRCSWRANNAHTPPHNRITKEPSRCGDHKSKPASPLKGPTSTVPELNVVCQGQQPTSPAFPAPPDDTPRCHCRRDRQASYSVLLRVGLAARPPRIAVMSDLRARPSLRRPCYKV